MDFWRLFGWFAGDGWFEKRGISIGTKSPSNAKLIASAMESVLKLHPKVRKRKFSDGHELFLISVYSSKLEKEWKQLLRVNKQKSKNFVFPDGLNLEESRSFIAGLFDAEAYQYKWRGRDRVAFEIFNENAARKVFDKLKEDCVSACLSKIKRGGTRIDITGDKAVSQFCLLYRWPCRE